MRDPAKEGKTRPLVPALKESATVSRFCSRAAPRVWASRIVEIALFCGLSLLAGWSLGCDQRSKSLREWRPEDHQPPPAEPPEGQGAAEESGDSTARAVKALWSMRCAQCHGEEGRGDGNGRPPGAQLPDFASAELQDKRSDSELYQVIDKGRNMMPAFGQELTKPGIEALIGHVRSLRAK
jgi:mono/diheme cytochrome c family protein